MILVVVKNPIRPKYADEFPKLNAEFTAATRAEPGNLWFEWSRSVDDPRTYVLVEAFTVDGAAGDPHVNTRALQEGDRAPPDAVLGRSRDRERRSPRRMVPHRRGAGRVLTRWSGPRVLEPIGHVDRRVRELLRRRARRGTARTRRGRRETSAGRPSSPRTASTPSGPATKGPNVSPWSSAMCVPAAAVTSPHVISPSSTNTTWSLLWPCGCTIIPGSHSA